MKKINLLFSTVILGALSLGVVIPAFAEDIGNSVSVTGTVTFEANDNATEAKDPKDPSKPNPVMPDPNNATTGAKGPLSLDVAPSSFDFGSNKVEMGKKDYISNMSGNHYLQITDNRDNADGWMVKVYRSEFENETSALTGSTFTIPAGVARNSLNEIPSEEDGTLLTAGKFAIPVGESSAVSVVGATSEEAVGKQTTTYVWDASEEVLTIPANTGKQGTFTSTINWIVAAEVSQ